MEGFIETSKETKAGTYIIIEHNSPRIFEKLKKYGIKYVNSGVRTMLQIYEDTIVYKLNEQEKQYEPIIKADEELVIKIFRGEKISKRFCRDSRFYYHSKAKNFIKETNVFIEPIRQVINNFITLSKLTQSIITIYLRKTRIEVRSDIISSEELEKILLNNYPNLFKREHTTRYEDAYENTIVTWITNIESIYDFKVINKKLSIPLESVEKIKKDADLSKMHVEIRKHDSDQMVGKFSLYYEIIVKTNCYPYYTSHVYITKEQVDMISDINLLDLDFMKAMYYIIFFIVS